MGDVNIINLLVKWNIVENVRLQGRFSRQNHFYFFELPEFASQTHGVFHHAELFTHYEPWAGSNNLRILGGFAYTNEYAIEKTAEVYSPYLALHGRLPVHTNLRLELGGRLNAHSNYGTNFTYHINPFYVLFERYKFYGTLSTSFRAPLLSELHGRFGGNTELNPEKALNWEVGIAQLESKKDSRDLRWGWQVAYYQRVISDLIVYELESMQLRNRNRQEDRGAELRGSLFWKNKVSASIMYGWVDGFGKETTTDPATEQVRNLQRYNLYRRPHHTYRLDIGYNPIPALTLRAHLQGYSARIDRDFAQGTTVTLNPYVLVDAYASYAFWKKRMHVFADFKNILNNTNHIEAYGYQTTGTRFMLGLQYDLGTR